MALEEMTVEEVIKWFNNPFVSDFDKQIVKDLFFKPKDPFEQIADIAWTVGLSSEQNNSLVNILSLEDNPLFNPENLADLRKVEWFEENFNRFTVEELESKMQ